MFANVADGTLDHRGPISNPLSTALRRALACITARLR